jgi:hypothetical protein
VFSAALLAVALLVWSSRAAAEKPSAEDLAAAGRLAFSLGEYDYALQALAQAYRLTLEEELLFSVAECHRQRHAIRGDAVDLVQAHAHYRLYVRSAPAGRHRRAAERHLAALTLELENRGLEEGEPQSRPSATRLVVTSDALGAVVRIDGKRARKLPLLVELTPGRHELRVRAPGYRTSVRKIDVRKGTLYAASVALHPMPARLDVDGPSGSALHVDGELVGSLPLEKPLAAEPGRHFVAVTAKGHHPHGEEVVLARGELARLQVELEATDQRTAAWLLMSAGGAGLAAGIALGVAAVVEHRRSQDILEPAADGSISDENQREFDEIIAARDDFRLGSGIAAGIGLGVFLLGGALFILDDPVVPRGDERVSATPILGPDGGGAQLTLRF